ncbi:hypothetical protein I79_025704 [Cricetulus griseus]|uniref:Uncharacterized protein n=1 Tax=Cricetulus griseus TaxID=10029 RepID=G3IP05_CRIGR|nr:hypothetical protein I79_025704 [Cricetulus griseus]
MINTSRASLLVLKLCHILSYIIQNQPRHDLISQSSSKKLTSVRVKKCPFRENLQGTISWWSMKFLKTPGLIKCSI